MDFADGSHYGRGYRSQSEEPQAMGQASGIEGEQTEDLFIAAATSPKTNGADAATRADRLRVSVSELEDSSGWQECGMRL